MSLELYPSRVRSSDLLGRVSATLSSLLHSVQHGFDVNDRRSVKGFKIEDFESGWDVYFNNAYAMKPHRVGSILRASTEYTSKRGTQIISGMYAQSLSNGAVQPGQNQDLIAGPKIDQPFLEFWLKNQPCLR